MSKLFDRLYSPRLIVPLLGIFVLLMAIEGTWTLELYHRWYFCLLVLVLLAYLGISIFRGFEQHRSWAYHACHIGFFVLVFGMLCSAPFFRQGQVILYAHQPVRLAYTPTAQPMAIPFELEVQDFHIDYYDDGIHPRQYTTRFTLTDLVRSGHPTRTLTTSVNHPCRYHGYRFYQDSYDAEHGQYTVLRIVRDPWLPVVWIGMLLLAAGTCLSMSRQWRLSIFLPVAIALAVLFALISVARINFSMLMPALRSLWFVPHLIIYMLAYSLLAIALILGCIALFTHRDVWRDRLTPLSSSLLHTASGLLLLGMLCGAVWAKQAWGDYWAWDAKECWAAATWLLTVGATHLFADTRHRDIARVVLIALAFLCMQITWYGVNYLPSARHSLHTYNTAQIDQSTSTNNNSLPL